MSVYKRRISAMQALVAGTAVAGNPVMLTTINSEFDEVKRVQQTMPLQRRRLLQVLHSTRALDSFLKSFTDSFGIRGTAHSLNEYLIRLENHNNPRVGRLTNGRASYYKVRIANVRNTYMHEAGAFPSSEPEIQTLLSNMHTCLIEIASL